MRRIPLVFAGLLAAALLVELVVRVVNPSPRTQVLVDGRGITLQPSVDRIPLWLAPAPPGAPDLPPEPPAAPCHVVHPDRPVITLVGDSIWYGFTPPGSTVARTLEAHLQARVGDRYCILNLSVPGFAGRQQLATLRQHLATTTPAFVFWEVWKPDGAHVRVGDVVIDADPYLRHAAGPAEGLPWMPVPGAVHAALSAHSAAWRLLTLAVAPLHPDDPSDDVPAPRNFHALADARALCAERNIPFLPVLTPPMNRPFHEVAGKHFPDVRAWAEAEHQPLLDLAVHLADDDPADLRVDLCCHLNDAGHARVAGLLGDWLLASPP